MEKDDSVYLGHRLDRAEQVIGKVRGTTAPISTLTKTCVSPSPG
jgi:hypothetical protein